MAGISQRKSDHIELALNGDVGFRRTSTLLDGVRLPGAGMALPGVGETTDRNQGWIKARGAKR